MASLTLKHVDRAFPNGYEAVKDLNFQIEDGEFVILTGPSGSGKSAVMRMIAGLDEVKNGEIWIGDKLVNSLPPEERGIAMIFQNYTVYPRMTVLENVELGLRLRGIDEKDRKTDTGSDGTSGSCRSPICKSKKLVRSVETSDRAGACHDFGTRCNPYG